MPSPAVLATKVRPPSAALFRNSRRDALVGIGSAPANDSVFLFMRGPFLNGETLSHKVEMGVRRVQVRRRPPRSNHLFIIEDFSPRAGRIFWEAWRRDKPGMKA